MTYRAGIVGCGRIGSGFDDSHAAAYLSANDVELVAICDSQESKLEECSKRWGVASLYKDYREMLRKENLDILSICTWNSSHPDITKEAVSSGVKAIFCEKPIADTLSHADEMVKLCRDQKVILQIDHQRRFNNFYQQIGDFLQKGEMGGIQQVSCYYTRGIANSGSHMFDLLRFLFGNVNWIQAAYSQNKSANPADPNIDGIMKFSNDIFCAIQACDDQNFLIFEIDCIGTKGRLNIIRNGSAVEYYEVTESKIIPGYNELYSSQPPFEINNSRKLVLNGVEHLVECLKGGQESISSGEDGRAALELICAFHESVDTNGRRVELPLRDSHVIIKSQ